MRKYIIFHELISPTLSTWTTVNLETKWAWDQTTYPPNPATLDTGRPLATQVVHWEPWTLVTMGFPRPRRTQQATT